MAQHVMAHGEGNGSWLPLIEYSVKSGVSLSTIRRKIKSNSIPYRLEKGKYLILFQGAISTLMEQPAEPIERQIAPVVAPKPVKQEPSDSGIEMISAAYEHAIKERDERVQKLEQRNQELQDQVNELRLLVRVLEEKYEVRY